VSLLVSICCVTYNHEKFIAQCLDGFVMQQTDFAFEILVHEDASTDRTAGIVKGYEKKYPHLFRCVYQTVNQFKIQNTLTNILFPMAKGKYIALCEGDDFWTDPCKLQKQVDFLEANSDFVLCYHEIKLLQPSGDLVYDKISEKSYWKSVANIYDLALFGNFIHTPSVVFRNVVKKFPEQLIKAPIGDFFLYILLAEKGLLKKLPDCMAVYRLSTGSFSSQTFEKRWENIRKTYQLIAKATNFRSVAVIMNLRAYQNKIYKAPFPNYFYEDQSVASIGKIIFKYLSYKNIFYALVKFVVEKTCGAKLSRKYFKLGRDIS